MITKASRHDQRDIDELLAQHGREPWSVRDGVTFVSRRGKIKGVVRLVDVAPGAVVIDELVIAAAEETPTLGPELLQAAMNSRGGTLYAFVRPDHRSIYEELGFDEVEASTMPPPVNNHFDAVGVLTDPEGTGATFMSAR